MIIDHNYPAYVERWNDARSNKWNGAYFYSKEIVRCIIPKIKTDRNWLTINTRGACLNHSIVFIHNNKHPENYGWLSSYNDLILICGTKTTAKRLEPLGKTIYLPLSVDVATVEKYKVKRKTRNVAFAGRAEKAGWGRLPMGCARISGLPRHKLLAEMAKYRKIYAVGRTAIEAKILGCEVLPYDPRFPDPSIWQILDCADAAKILQKELDEIDGTNYSTK